MKAGQYWSQCELGDFRIIRPGIAFWHFDATLLRHHHVEQHGVERRLGVHRDGLIAVAGKHDVFVAQALETATQHLPVVRVVVHHKQFDSRGMHDVASQGQIDCSMMTACVIVAKF